MENKNKKVLDYLFTCKEVKDFCKNNKLKENDIVMNFTQLSSYKECVEACEKCDGKTCTSITPNAKANLIYENGKIAINLYPCPLSERNKSGKFEVLNYTQNDIELVMTNPRYNLFKFLERFKNDYFSGKKTKGIYLWGPCGTGKSLLIYKFCQTLVSNGAKVMFVYYPDLVRDIQGSFGTQWQEELFVRLKQTDILVIDDIGREANTQYIRDEVLGPVLQYRVDNDLPMFMTSNRNMDMIEKHLSETNASIDLVKARALVERLKYLMIEYELNDINFRNNK